MRKKIVKWLSVKATNLSDLLIPKRNWNYSLDDYRQMPKNSLGNELYQYLTKHKITFKSNLVRHDVKHILLSYEMDIPDELKIHSFLLGNRSYNAFGIVYLMICTAIIPENIPMLIRAYKRGKIAKPFRGVNFQSLLTKPLRECQKELNIKLDFEYPQSP